MRIFSCILSLSMRNFSISSSSICDRRILSCSLSFSSSFSLSSSSSFSLSFSSSFSLSICANFSFCFAISSSSCCLFLDKFKISSLSLCSLSLCSLSLCSLSEELREPTLYNGSSGSSCSSSLSTGSTGSSPPILRSLKSSLCFIISRT